MTKTNPLAKSLLFFYAVEIISAVVYTIMIGFLGLLWLAVAISLLGVLPKFMPEKFTEKSSKLISQICLLLSSALFGYIVMYYLSGAPVVLTVILIFRIIATLFGFKSIKDQAIIVVPLLIGFALMQKTGCIPPVAF